MIIKSKTFDLHNFNLSVFKRGIIIYIYIYNKNYCCLLKINFKNKITINFKNKITINFKNKIGEGLNLIKFFLLQFDKCDLVKIKFTGKGYKIKKNSQESLILLFNKSHPTIIWWKNIFIKKLKKYKILIKYNQINIKVKNTIINVRPINIFTKRGLRMSRQLLLKKKGKK